MLQLTNLAEKTYRRAEHDVELAKDNGTVLQLTTLAEKTHRRAQHDIELAKDDGKDVTVVPVTESILVEVSKRPAQSARTDRRNCQSTLYLPPTWCCMLTDAHTDGQCRPDTPSEQTILHGLTDRPTNIQPDRQMNRH